VSVASLWEIAIKYSNGKLRLTDGVDGLMRAAFIENGFERLQIEPQILISLAALSFKKLPSGKEHRDPFDRLLVAQARAEGATLVTKETWWRGAYGVTVQW
jgi:PIN domain nuclease of toxin-antitoxin system